MERIFIKDYYNKIIGMIETDASGNKVAKDYYGKILGRYVKNGDYTTDYYGKRLSKGDSLSALIWEEYYKKAGKK